MVIGITVQFQLEICLGTVTVEQSTLIREVVRATQPQGVDVLKYSTIILLGFEAFIS